MRRLLVVLLIITVAIVFSVIFVRQGFDKGNVLKVGVLLPLTGDAAVVGEPARKGIEIALDEYKGAFASKGRKVELRVEDSQAKPGVGVAALNKLITVDRVALVVGPMASSVALATLDVANSNNIIMVSPSASSPALSRDDCFFRVELSETEGAKMQAELAVKKLDWKKFACLYVNNDYGRGTFDVFAKTLEDLGGNIVLSAPFDEGERDFRTTLSKVQRFSSGLDAVFVVFNTEVVSIIRQMKELGMNVPVYTTPVFESEKFVNELGVAAEGVLYTYYGAFDLASKAQVVRDFIKQYRDRYKETSSYYAALGYDAAGVALEGLLASLPEVTTEKVKEALSKLDYKGVTGEIRFDSNGDPHKLVVLKRVRNGEFVNYESK